MHTSILQTLLLRVRFVDPASAGRGPVDVYGSPLRSLSLRHAYPPWPGDGISEWLRFEYVENMYSSPALDKLEQDIEAAKAAKRAAYGDVQRNDAAAQEKLSTLERRRDAIRGPLEGIKIIEDFPLDPPSHLTAAQTHVRLIHFFEALRLIAMPEESRSGQHDAPVDRAASGWLGRGWLPLGYFFDTSRHKPLKQDGGIAGNAFRHDFFGVYCHVLLNILFRERPDVAGVLSDWSRAESDRARLFAALTNMAPDALTRQLLESSTPYIGTKSFAQLLATITSGDVNRLGEAVQAKLSGAPLKGLKHPPTATYLLPAILKALVLFSPVLTGERGRQFACDAPACEKVLSGAARFDHAAAICSSSLDEQTMVDVKGNTNANDAQPTHRSLARASLCAALERLIMTPARTGSQDAPPPDGPASPQDASAAFEAGRDRLRRAGEAAMEGRTTGGPSTGQVGGTSPERFVTAQAMKSPAHEAAPGTIAFTHVPNGWTVDFPQGQWQPFECEQERSDESIAPRGALWVPIPHALRKLPLTVEVYAVAAASDRAVVLRPLAYEIADAIEPPEGIAYWLIPERDDDPALPVSTQTGTSVVRALACRIGRQASAELLVIVGIADRTGDGQPDVKPSVTR